MAEESDRREIKNKAAELRLAKRISRVSVAERIGITEEELHRLEIGRTPIKLDAALRLADVLDCKIQRVFPITTKYLKAKGKPVFDQLLDKVNDSDVVRELAEGGVDIDYKSSFLILGLSNNVEVRIPIDGGERKRFWYAMQKVEEDSPFFRYAVGPVDVLINLTTELLPPDL